MSAADDCFLRAIENGVASPHGRDHEPGLSVPELQYGAVMILRVKRRSTLGWQLSLKMSIFVQDDCWNIWIARRTLFVRDPLPLNGRRLRIDFRIIGTLGVQR